MRTRSALLVFIALGVLGAGAEAKEPDLFKKLERLFADPPATGVLATQILPDSQAMTKGMKVGDVVVSYGGLPITDLPSIGAAKQSLGVVESIDMVVVRKGRRITLTLEPGPIGFMGAPVVEGVAAPGLPEDTGVTFDFSALRGAPAEEWLAFSLDGTTRVGFEHGVLQLRGDHLILRREVAFDGGEQWGLNHFDVTLIFRTKPQLQVIATRFLNPITDWIGTGRLIRRKGGARWRAQFPEAEPRMEPASERLLPTYLVVSLAQFMPREEGACYRFLPLNEGFGQTGLLSALVCKGKQELTVPGQKGSGAPDLTTRAWKYVWVQVGGAVAGTHWLADDGRILYSDYGGAHAFPATKEVALRNLHEGLVPRSAK